MTVTSTSCTSTNPLVEVRTYMTFDQVFHSYRYPAGERHTMLRPDAVLAPQVTIEMMVTGFEDLGHLLTADRILRRIGIQPEWFVPYFPFARHDRRNHPGYGFELGIALELVRDLDIVIADPHSDVAGQLPHFTQTSSVECFRQVGAFDANPVIVVPDAGATKKAFEWADGDLVQAHKHRDPATGRLSSFEILTGDLDGAPCIIVDDICDGGGTFLGLAKELQAKNAGSLTLAITHGLFTKGTDELDRAFDRIITFGHTGTTAPTKNLLPFSDLYNKGARR